MKNSWGIIVILAVFMGMFYLYDSLHPQSIVTPENQEIEEAALVGNANQGLPTPEEPAKPDLDLESLSGLEAELNPLEELRETL
ncbi:MAG TPA: hypothetical protein PLN18_01955 [Candidatus Colwellbacteria bacterium]|nr:hypothetical protein [Candidatus Colwellbacteria bacterium]HQA96109.1 hypothetical protein [Candidatus Colwellbacteria bacterium]